MEYQTIEKILGYEFADKELLERALTHSSFANEHTGNAFNGNERLEFVGDAVLDVVVGSYLYGRLPESPEGMLTKLRASIVCEKALGGVSFELGLNDFLLLGKGEERTGGRTRLSIAADGVEALIGAVFLDGGYGAAERTIRRILGKTIEEAVSGGLPTDAKSELQELLQSLGYSSIKYEITGESGPEHDKSFEACVMADGSVLGRGSGKSKKDAESSAAAQALGRLKR